MNNYIKICSKCGRENLANADMCKCGESIIMVRPILKTENASELPRNIQYEENIVEEKICSEKKYRRCLVCGMKNYILDGIDVRKCQNSECKNNELFRSRIEMEKISTTTLEKKVRDESDISDSESKLCDESAECKKILQLRFKLGNKILDIRPEGEILGRMGSVNAELFEEYPYVGRMHCEIKCIDGQWKIKDMSTNGTRINGKVIEKNKYVNINDKDVVSLANAHFEVNI